MFAAVDSLSDDWIAADRAALLRFGSKPLDKTQQDAEADHRDARRNCSNEERIIRESGKRRHRKDRPADIHGEREQRQPETSAEHH